MSRRFTDGDLSSLSDAIHGAEWSQIIGLYQADARDSPAAAEMLLPARDLARFNAAAQRAATAWRRSARSSQYTHGRIDRLARLAVERLRAAVEGRVQEARQILARELDDQPRESDVADSSLPPYNVIDLISYGVRPAPQFRVRGVGRPMPDNSPGLGDPGSILTLGLNGFSESEFERGRPLELVGSWNPAASTFEVQRAVRLGLWPGRKLMRSALNLSADAEGISSTPEAPDAADHRAVQSRDYVAEALASGEADAILDRAAAASGVSLRTIGMVHRLLAPTAAEAGHIRSRPATVRLHHVPFYKAPAPAVARVQLRGLLLWLRRTAMTVHPLPRAAEAWARLCEAHPYSDGNGRVARALARWILTSAGYRALGGEELRDFAYQHSVEYYHRLRWWRSERLLWYHFCVDALLATFDPPPSPRSPGQR